MYQVKVPRLGAVSGKPRPVLASQLSHACQKNETSSVSCGPPDHSITTGEPAVIVPPELLAMITSVRGVSGGLQMKSHVPPGQVECPTCAVKVPSKAHLELLAVSHHVHRLSAKQVPQEVATHGFLLHITPSPSNPSLQVHSRFETSSLAVLQVASIEQPLV